MNKTTDITEAWSVNQGSDKATKIVSDAASGAQQTMVAPNAHQEL